jgi:hypothetical protein
MYKTKEEHDDRLRMADDESDSSSSSVPSRLYEGDRQADAASESETPALESSETAPGDQGGDEGGELLQQRHVPLASAAILPSAAGSVAPESIQHPENEKELILPDELELSDDELGEFAQIIGSSQGP